MTHEHKKIYTPIILLVAWLTTTVLLFRFGPYDYKIDNSIKLYSYLAAIHIALLLGYIWGQRFPGRGSKLKIDYIKLVKVSAWISFAYVALKLVSTSGGDVANFFLTFSDANLAYDTNSLRSTNIFSYLDIFFVPLIIMAFTNTLFTYGRQDKWTRFAIYLILAILFAASVGSATRSGIVKNFMLISAALALGYYKKNIIFKTHHKVFTATGLIIFISCFFLYFSFLLKSRDVLGYVVLKNPITKELPNADSVLYKVTPPSSHKLLNDVSIYTSHSYFRLSKALDLPQLGLGFGLSNSYFVMNNIYKLTGSRWLMDISYPLRLDKEAGNSFGAFWSTFYSWIASDFTFPGTIVVVFFIGFAFSLTLKDSLHSFNALAVTSFCVLFYFIFHFAFNNPLQDGQGIMTFFFIPFLWLIFRDKKSERI